MEVTLEEMLSAREARAFLQFQLNRQWGLPLISFSLNIPGPIKNTPLIRRGFWEGCRKLEERLPGDSIRYQQTIVETTGCEAIYVVDMDAAAAKAITTAIEDENRLGRLYDMDVLDENLNKLDRCLVGGKSRDCIVCGAPGRGCASRRLHSVSALQEATNQILTEHFRESDAHKIGNLATQALLEEVATTPKPGLVDQRNTGSHTDMDIQTFQKSAHALTDYFCSCVRTGMQTSRAAGEDTFYALRQLGLQAEQDMYHATGGVNTHKGAIFTIGILCGAVGRLWNTQGEYTEADLLAEVSTMTTAPMEKDLREQDPSTAGMRLYTQHGIRGIRGEVSLGLPSVRDFGLPVYRRCLEQGLDSNMAGVVTLLNLIVAVVDTNMIKRGGMELAMDAIRKTAQLLMWHEIPEVSEIEALDDWFIEKNLSPGGCADLLAAVYFIQKLEAEKTRRSLRKTNTNF